MGKSKIPSFVMGKDVNKLYCEGSYLVLDFESDTEEKGSALCLENSLVLACWSIHMPGQKPEIKYKFGNEYEMHELLEDIKTVKFIVAQNLKFEMQWLKRCGAELRDILGYDTLLGAWVQDGNLDFSRDLDSLATRYNVNDRKIDLVKRLIIVGWNPRNIPKSWLLTYCHRDVAVTHQVFLAQREILRVDNLLHIVHTRNLCCAVLADIEFEGMCLDKQAVLEEYEKVRLEHEVTQRQLEDMAEGINLNSPIQLAEFLYGKLGFVQLRDRGKVVTTPSGRPMTNADTLLKLEATTDEQVQFVELYRRYNKLGSLLSKSLIFFKGVVDEKDGKFFAVFNQNVTKTHRLSSSGRPIVFMGSKTARSAQFQNLPREYKRLFYAGQDGWDIGEVDGAQLEFRVGADLGQDGLAKQEIEEGFDVHSATAKVLLEAKDEELVKAAPENRRQLAKKSTFSPLFGGRGATKAKQAYAEFFKKKYAGISKTQTEWTMQVMAHKKLRTPYGLIFYWPKATMNKWGDCNYKTEIFNFPIQGLSTGEIIPIALVFFWHRTRGLPIVLLNTIHDSLVCKVRSDCKEDFKQIAKQAMTKDVFTYLSDIYKYNMRVPLGIGLKCSRNWSATKEEYKVDVWHDGRELER